MNFGKKIKRNFFSKTRANFIQQSNRKVQIKILEFFLVYYKKCYTTYPVIIYFRYSYIMKYGKDKYNRLKCLRA